MKKLLWLLPFSLLAWLCMGAISTGPSTGTGGGIATNAVARTNGTHYGGLTLVSNGATPPSITIVGGSGISTVPILNASNVNAGTLTVTNQLNLATATSNSIAVLSTNGGTARFGTGARILDIGTNNPFGGGDGIGGWINFWGRSGQSQDGGICFQEFGGTTGPEFLISNWSDHSGNGHPEAIITAINSMSVNLGFDGQKTCVFQIGGSGDYNLISQMQYQDAPTSAAGNMLGHSVPLNFVSRFYDPNTGTLAVDPAIAGIRGQPSGTNSKLSDLFFYTSSWTNDSTVFQGRATAVTVGGIMRSNRWEFPGIIVSNNAIVFGNIYGATYTGNAAGLTNVTGDDTAYAASWDGNTNPPTKNAVYDKIQTISGTVSSVSSDTNLAVATPTSTPVISVTNVIGSGALVKQTNSTVTGITHNGTTTNNGVMRITVGTSASAPPLANHSAPTTGIDFDATHVFFNVGGATQWSIGSGSLYNDGGSGVIRPGNGLIGAPAFSFTSETTSGLYRNASGDLRMSVGSADVTKWTAANFTVLTSSSIPTNTANFDFTTGWATTLATRYTNGTRRATLLLGLKLIDTATGTPVATIKIEQNGAGGALTNTFLFSEPGTIVSTITNTVNCGRLNPGAVVTITDTSTGTGASIAIDSSVLESE